MSINDNTGIGATGNVDIVGNLRSIQVKDSGFDYRQVPTIQITGGNGEGAVARPNMKLVDHNPTFNAQSVNDIGIGATQSIIGFTTFHKFRNNEPVYYRTDGQDGLVGLATDALYYIHVVDEFQVKLMPTQGDAIVGINTMVITDYGVGRQSLETVHQKLILDSVNIVNSGSGYSYKKRTTTTAGIDTSANLITINNHGYKSGEIVNYTTENPYVDNRLSGVGTFSQIIAGLSSNTDYYITAIDDNSFKLSQVGIATIDKTIYYDTQQFIDLSSVGLGYHCFNYPNINVSISGLVGISTVERVGVSTVDFQAKLQPIFRGSVQGAHLKTNGIGYGSSTIMNNVRQPSLNLSFGDRCQLAVEVIEGALTEVIVINRGNGYNSPPDILVPVSYTHLTLPTKA